MKTEDDRDDAVTQGGREMGARPIDEPAGARRRCCCLRFMDAAGCVEERYGYSRREALEEPCECACHYEDGDE